jgi:hypothetical protein
MSDLSLASTAAYFSDPTVSPTAYRSVIGAASITHNWQTARARYGGMPKNDRASLRCEWTMGYMDEVLDARSACGGAQMISPSRTSSAMKLPKR